MWSTHACDDARLSAYGDPDRRRRPGRVPRGRPRPAPPVRAGAPDRPGRVRRRGAGGAAGDEAARRPGRGDPGRLPDAADERHRVPRAGDGPVPGRAAGRCSPPTPTPTPPSTRSTSSTSTTTCSSPGTRRRRSSTRWSTRCWRRGGDSDHRTVPETKVVGHRWSARSSEVREFLARNQVPYRWYLSDEPEGQRLLAGGRRRTASRLPVVITAGRRGAGRADRRRAGRPGRAGHDAVAGLLRPHRDRRRPGRPGRGGVRRLRGAAHRARRAHRDRRPGRPELPDRELPRLPRRGVRRPAHRPGPAAGAQVRRRGAHHPRRGRPGGQRRRRARCGSPTAPRSTRTPSSWPPGSPTGSWRAPGSTELTGRGVFYGSALTEAAACAGQDVYIVGGANSAGQAAVYLARHAKSVTHPGPRPVAGASMSYYLIQQIEAIPNISVRTCTEVVGGARRRAPGAAHPARQHDRRRPRRSTRSGCSCSSARPR